MSEPTTPDDVRRLYQEKVCDLPSGAPLYRWGSFDRLLVGLLLDEIQRLKEGRFTEEEFQNLCRAYQEKLFGGAAPSP